MKIYKTAEVCEIVGISKQRLSQLRLAHTRKVGKYNYDVAATLVESKDWKWEQGEVIYFASALKKLKK